MPKWFPYPRDHPSYPCLSLISNPQLLLLLVAFAFLTGIFL